tara:strand:- start:3736 stop:4194 length:459 start_codon:yes stop_codon:yes gene_type:complete
MARARGDTRTLDLLDWQPPKVAVGFEDEIRAASLDAKIAKALARAIRESGKTRPAIAKDMSLQLGRPVSVSTIDAYTSEAKEGHRIPLDRFIALIHATGSVDLLGWLAEEFGYVVVPAQYRDLIELHFIRERRREIEDREAALEARWKGSRR